MNIKCGTDIIEINRIKDSIEDTGDKFINRVYTKNEIKYCEGKKNQKFQHYAARFAAKEAVFKAVSEKIKDKYSICWKDIEISNDEQGRPSVEILGDVSKEIECIDISLSHCKEYATAFAVVKFK